MSALSTKVKELDQALDEWHAKVKEIGEALDNQN